MPKSWWGRAIVVVYVAGYWLRLAIIGFVMWPRLGLGEWRWYMTWQTLYGLVWPIWLFWSQG